MSFCYMENSELQKRYKDEILPSKEIEAVICLLRKKYTLRRVEYSEIDQTSKMTIPHFGDTGLIPSEVFLVEKAACSEWLYQRMEHDFNKDIDVLICLFEDFLSSNCSALDLEMSILRGISFEDCQSESPNYYFYLSQIQVFEAVTGRKWHDYYREQPYYKRV